MRKIVSLVLPVTVMLIGCRSNNPVDPPQKVASEFSLCVLQYHGAYYDSIASNVATVDLYSEGLCLDSAWRIEGTGTNLCLSDVFFPMNTDNLAEGVYRASDNGEEMTYLRGQDFDGMPNGAYLYQLRENSLVKGSITLLVDSTMTVQYVGDSLDLRFTLMQSNGFIYKGHYRGVPVLRE